MKNENRKALNSEDLLEKIFYYMSKMFEEKEFSTTIELLTDLGRTLVNSDRASFWFWDKRKHQYWTMAASDNEKITVDEEAGIVGASIATNKTILINAPYEDKRFNDRVDKETGYITKSILCMPVTNTEGEVIGAYQAINKYNENGEEGEFDETDIRRLSLAAAFCAQALESYLLHNEALGDQLTGLKNRRGFYDHYQKRVMPVMQKDVVSIVMCDIDFFKKVNDQYGHNAGDAMLCHIANILQSNIGIDDAVIRWGGEEFILLLSRKTGEEARNFAESLRKQVEASVCLFEGQELRVTMSFGVATLDNKLTPDENVKQVDARLYEAKNTGRNKVV